LKRLFPLLAAIALSLAACTSLQTSLPLTDQPPQPPLSSSVFAGHAQAARFVAGSWQPLPEHDYDFIVMERRFAERWEAVKEIHRRHPRYDGGAGPRDQTLYFTVRTSTTADGGLDLAVEGSLGTGKGHMGPEGGLIIELTAADRGWFVPFDTVRISQSRQEAAGRLAETVELFSRRNGEEVPFMRMTEEGIVYRPTAPQGELKGISP
jgi:hypothetical protein